MKVLFLIVIGVLIAIAILKLIFKKSLYCKTGKIQQLREQSEKLKLQSKKKQVEGLKARLRAAKTNEEKARLQRILNEQTLFLERMLKK